MMGLGIQIDGGQTSFRGGHTIAGEISWSLPKAPDELVLELLWTTRGKGTVDTEVVQSIRIHSPPAAGRRRFERPLPHAPVSFNGKLVSLIWYLRLLAKPSNEQAQMKIVLSPTGEEVELG